MATKTKVELEREIINLNMIIHTEFPDFSKIIEAMPERASGINIYELNQKNL